MHNVYIENPSILKIALEVAIEVTYIDLSTTQSNDLKTLTKELPHTASPITISLSTDQKIDLVLCLRHFYQSRSYRWIREYLIDAIREFENQLLNQGTMKK